MAERNPSKKRRQAQNEAARSAREARSSAARSTPARAAARDDAADEGSGNAAKGGVFGRSRSAATPARTARPAPASKGSGAASPRPSRVAATKAGSTSKSTGTSNASGDRPARPSRRAPREGRPLPAWTNRFGGDEPGGRWVLLSLVMALVASAALSVAKVFSDVDPKTHKIRQVIDAKTHKLVDAPLISVFHYGVGKGLVVVLPVPLAVLVTVLTSRPPVRRRTWNFGFVAVALLAVLGGPTLLFHLPTILLLGLGCWQARAAALAEFDGDRVALRDYERASMGRRRGAAPADDADELDGADDADDIEVDLDADAGD